MNSTTLILRFRFSLCLFIVGLVLSGLTAFPLLAELNLLTKFLGSNDPTPLTGWILKIREGLTVTYASYPWIGYGTDWLAFGHLVIALFFIGPLCKPRISKMNLHSGMIACVSIVPLALICGPLRGIPFYWQMIDCSFGIFGILPLIYCLRLLKRIEQIDLAATAKIQ